MHGICVFEYNYRSRLKRKKTKRSVHDGWKSSCNSTKWPSSSFCNPLPAASSKPSHKAPPKNKRWREIARQRQAENENWAACFIWTTPRPPNTATPTLTLGQLPLRSVPFTKALLYILAPPEGQGHGAPSLRWMTGHASPCGSDWWSRDEW